MTPARFRRKPRTVEAVRYDGTEASIDAIYEWLGKERLSTLHTASGPLGLWLNVSMRSQHLDLQPGQWLARDGDGRLHVLDPDDLAENYEIMEGAEDE